MCDYIISFWEDYPVKKIAFVFLSIMLLCVFSSCNNADNGGEPSKTPYIQDGYWYIDGVNTNVKAEGKDGVSGKDGKGIVSIEYTSTHGLKFFKTVIT